MKHIVLAAMIALNSPEHMLDICLAAIADSDLTVVNAGVDHLSLLDDILTKAVVLK